MTILALVLSGLAIQAGGTLIGLGAKIALPEISKALGTNNIEKISESIDIKKVRETTLESMRRMKLKSK